MTSNKQKPHQQDGIVRRDFLNGVGVAIGGSLLGIKASATLATVIPEPTYPPALTGMRGSHPGSFEVAHNVVRGQNWSDTANPLPIRESYDLIVVGAGISGLSAAYMYLRDIDANAKILILDNHDDFGGHAKRNEFSIDGKTLIGFGGTMLIESPGGYPQVADEVMRELGLNYASDKDFNHDAMIDRLGLKRSYFLDKETFGSDKLVVGDLYADNALDDTSLSEQGKTDVKRLFADEINYLAGLSTDEIKTILDNQSWREYLRDYADMGEEALTMIQKRPHGVWAIGADALPAWLAWDSGYPGFGDLDLGAANIDGDGEGDATARVRFPDGNATVARLLVSRLVPACTPARSVEDIVTARFDYDKLDQANNQTRVRVSSTVVKVAHRNGDLAGDVDVTYVQHGTSQRVSAPKVIWAGYHAMLPYVAPDLSEAQSEALATSVRAPLVYTNVLLRNWRSLAGLGTHRVDCPGSFFQHARITHPVSFGNYHYAKSPDEPVILHMQHIPLAPGLSASQQFKAGRQQLLETTFATFEANIRDQLTRMFGAGGFDADKDIAGITVNRWSHGYAYTTDSATGDVAWYPERWEKQPWVTGRRSIGNIAIAGTDAASNAMTESAIQEAHRAVQEFR